MPRLPSNNQHHVIVGRNGTGKTRAAVWHLSMRNYGTMPWIIFDFKRDDLIARLPTTEISIDDAVPRDPGLYVLHPHPRDQDGVADFITRIWDAENVGTYVDEGYMIKSRAANDAFELLLTQGRSKSCPTITLSQRPVWINRFCLSEATFIQLFSLNDKRDKDTLLSLMPDEAAEDLPDYHSWYYDVGNNELSVMMPVPDDDTIVGLFPVPEAPGEVTQVIEPQRIIL